MDAVKRSAAIMRSMPRNMVYRRYKSIPRAAVTIIVNAAQVHGSQGRAIQLGMELLVRRKRRLKLTLPDRPAVDMGFGLTARTAALIDQLSPMYGRRGLVLAACAQLLQE